MESFERKEPNLAQGELAVCVSKAISSDLFIGLLDLKCNRAEILRLDCLS